MENKRFLAGQNFNIKSQFVYYAKTIRASENILKKTLLVQQLWNHRGSGAALETRERKTHNKTFLPIIWSILSPLLDSITKNHHLINRPGQFNYQDAIHDDLPIGSGEIESAHGYVIQERLKLSGCWWKLENAMTMLALRVLRANGNWDNYWLQTQVAIAA